MAGAPLRSLSGVALVGLYVLSFPAVASAALGDDEASPFTAICQIAETCRIDGGCATLPAPGELIVQFDGTVTSMGQTEAELRPLDRFAEIEDAYPLPRLNGARRSLLVDLPPDPADRRFALFVQRPTGTADPVLQPTYFILACDDLRS